MNTTPDIARFGKSPRRELSVEVTERELLMSLTSVAIATYRGDWVDRARVALNRLFGGDPQGEVAALTQVDLEIGADYTTAVFADADGNHFAVTLKGDVEEVRVVRPDGDVWVQHGEQVRSLAHHGEILASLPTTPEWTTQAAYAVGDRVAYLGDTYEAIQTHTSQAGWEPPNAPALWTKVTA